VTSFARRREKSGSGTRVAHLTNYRLVLHFKFLLVGPDQKLVTKRPYSWSPGLGAFCNVFRARPDCKGLRAKFGRRLANNIKYKL
jgi:hypothetical protein